MTYDIITIGGATYDITFFPNEKETFLIDNKQDVLRQKLLAFEHGAKISAEKVIYGFGGGAANTAVSFANFGFKSAAIIPVGDDIFGREIIANFRKKKVRTELIQKIPRYASDLAMIIIAPDKDRVIFFDSKVKNKLLLDRKCLNAIKNTRWVYLNSLTGEWDRVLGDVFSIKNKKINLKIAWNPGQAQLMGGLPALKEYIKQTAVLILNHDEAIQLAMSDPEIKNKKLDLNNIKNLLPIIKNYGPEIAVITCGKEGAWAFDGVEMHYAPIVEKQARVDTTGVGDAFGSSFISGLDLFRGDIDKAMKLGILNTASVVAAPGAQNGLLGKKDLRKLNL